MSNDPMRQWPPREGVDGLPVPDTSPDLLDMNQVRAHIEQAIKLRRYTGTTDPIEYLVQRRCLSPVDGGYQATLTGVLCFGKNPQEIFSRAVIDLGYYRGSEPLTYEVVSLQKNIGGTIFSQLTIVENFLNEHTHRGLSLSKTGFQATPILQYPEYVVRELTVNMLAHRDYTNIASVPRVQLFRNRIEWANPGGLLPGLSLDKILQRQAARNPVLLQVLYDAGYVEAFGQGLDTVVRQLEREGMSPPKFEADEDSFSVTVYGRSLDLLYGEGAYEGLRESQRKILSIIFEQGEVGSREIVASFEDRAKRSILRDLEGLIEANLVYTVGKGRALRYRIREDLLR